MSDITSESSNKKGKRGHKEACVWNHFIKESTGSRGRPEDLKSHLALFCNVIPQDIKLEYLEILASINSSRKIKKHDSSSDKLVSDYYDPTTKIETS
ncbi:1191_t:CDS:2 [Cetraspora pellucida]|uniref:1191_t:CDS:1 n=1 Tax=Cetraspora pellucida TaxID=1433469 RepID=A0ACA9NRW9_9GLOM|nr:1191_t:CDS:2 [Cetraspora pellucida]